jgi:hypothetical protein
VTMTALIIILAAAYGVGVIACFLAAWALADRTGWGMAKAAAMSVLWPVVVTYLLLMAITRME